MSEFEQLIGLKFSELTEEKFQRLLTLIVKEGGGCRDTYLLITIAKELAEIYRVLRT